jgi:endonuclease YncB( thermonuclease family)
LSWRATARVPHPRSLPARGREVKVFLLLALLLPSWAAAAEPWTGLEPLTEIGATASLRLAGIELPERAPPLLAQAQARIAELFNQARFLKATAKPDRWNRLPVEAISQDGRWVQAVLLAEGLARVATTPDERLGAAEMLAAEDQARQARRGIWAEPAYALRRPEDCAKLLDSVQVVEGTIASVDVTKSAVYLNFVEDWRHGLGIRIPHGLLRKLAYDPASLNGHRLRVRGWIGKGAGPLIEVSHAEQIEVLDGPPLFPPPAKESK